LRFIEHGGRMPRSCFELVALEADGEKWKSRRPLKEPGS
jgi:hypothetical protein